MIDQPAKFLPPPPVPTALRDAMLRKEAMFAQVVQHLGLPTSVLQGAYPNYPEAKLLQTMWLRRMTIPEHLRLRQLPWTLTTKGRG